VTQYVGVGGFAGLGHPFPDTKDGAYGYVAVEVRAAVKRVERDNVFALLAPSDDLGSAELLADEDAAEAGGASAFSKFLLAWLSSHLEFRRMRSLPLHADGLSHAERLRSFAVSFTAIPIRSMMAESFPVAPDSGIWISRTLSKSVSSGMGILLRLEGKMSSLEKR